jgi:hypothetical protein
MLAVLDSVNRKPSGTRAIARCGAGRRRPGVSRGRVNGTRRRALTLTPPLSYVAAGRFGGFPLLRREERARVRRLPGALRLPSGVLRHAACRRRLSMKGILFIFLKTLRFFILAGRARGRVEGWLTGVPAAPRRAALCSAHRPATPARRPRVSPRCHAAATLLNRSCKIGSCHGVRVWPIHRARRRRGAHGERGGARRDTTAWRPSATIGSIGSDRGVVRADRGR